MKDPVHTGSFIFSLSAEKKISSIFPIVKFPYLCLPKDLGVVLYCPIRPFYTVVGESEMPE